MRTVLSADPQEASGGRMWRRRVLAAWSSSGEPSASSPTSRMRTRSSPSPSRRQALPRPSTGDRHSVGPGDLIVLNPEEAHAGGPPAEGSWTYRALYPCPRLVRGIMTEFPEARPTMPYFGKDVVRDREVTARLRRFHQLSEISASSMLERETHLAGALVLLIGRHAANPKGPRPPGRNRRRSTSPGST